MYKTAFFDLGNVLVFFSVPKMVAQMAHCTGLAREKISELLLGKGLRDLYEMGTLTSEGLFEIFRQLSPKTFSAKEFFEAASDIFQPNEGCYPLLKALKSKGIRLLALSNTSHAHFEFLKNNFTFLNLFDEFILSYQVGAAKPDPKIYTAALSIAGCTPQECFYIDDIPEYIEMAKTCGIDGEVFKDVASLKEHLTSRNLI